MVPQCDIDQLKGALPVMLPDLKSRWPLSYLGVFGSWARQEQRAGSDLDLLVDSPLRLSPLIARRSTP